MRNASDHASPCRAARLASSTGSLCTAGIVAACALAGAALAQQGAAPAAPASQAAAAPAKTSTSEAGGYAIDHDARWMVQQESAAMLLLPSLETADPEDAEFYAFNSIAWKDDASLADDAAADKAMQSLLGEGARIKRQGPVERTKDGMLVVRGSAELEPGLEFSVQVAARRIGDRLVGVTTIGRAGSIDARCTTARSLLASARAPGTGGSSAPGAKDAKSAPDIATPSAASTGAPAGGGAKGDGKKESVNAAGGFAFRHDPAWVVRSEGATTILTRDESNLDPADPDFYGFNSIAWSAERPLSDPGHAEAAAQELLRDSSELQREGALEPLPGGGVMLRCKAMAEDGRTMRLRILARSEGDTLVGIVIVGTEQSIVAREAVARELFSTLRFVERVLPKGDADPAFVGTWSTDEVLSSGGGFDAGGSATMVTQRILDLGADGRYSVASRSAGGTSGATFESGRSVDDRGAWKVVREGELSYLVLTSAEGGSQRIRCAMHEGQLVLGEPGQRKFFARQR